MGIYEKKDYNLRLESLSEEINKIIKLLLKYDLQTSQIKRNEQKEEDVKLNLYKEKNRLKKNFLLSVITYIFSIYIYTSLPVSIVISILINLLTSFRFAMVLFEVIYLENTINKIKKSRKDMIIIKEKIKENITSKKNLLNNLYDSYENYINYQKEHMTTTEYKEKIEQEKQVNELQSIINEMNYQRIQK